MELLLGCGGKRKKVMCRQGHEEWTDLFTVDMNADHNPDLVYDISKIPLPFEDNSADEIHLYDVIEHMGQQGDWKFFFAQFEDFWRILRHGGGLFITTPHPTSPWAWADPGHTRVIPPEATTYLSQAEYVKQVGVTAMTDYRFTYKGNFEIHLCEVKPNLITHMALRAVKG